MANIPNFIYAIGDKVNTTLTSAISDTSTTINVASGVGFNPDGGYIIIEPNTVNEEIVYIESVSGNTLTVATNGRGRGATTAKSHPSGAIVTDIVTTEMFNRPRTALVQEHNDDGTHKLHTNTFDGVIHHAGMMNGYIEANITGNNLYLSLKTNNGTDPSLNNPIRVRIGNYIRKITSAKNITLVGGNNYFDMSSLGGNISFDVFLFLMFNPNTLSVEMGVTRLWMGNTYAKYNNTLGSYKQIVATGSTPPGNSEMELVGVLGIQKDSSNNFITGTYFSNVFNTPITRWQWYNPSVLGGGSMTVTNSSIYVATYQVNYNYIHTSISGTVTFGGTASNVFSVSLPAPAHVNSYYLPSLVVCDNSGIGTFYHYATIEPIADKRQVYIRKADNTNFPLGTGVSFCISATYPILE